METQKTCPACHAPDVHTEAEYGTFATLACDECGHMLLERPIAPTQPDDYIVADDAALRRMLKSTRDKEFDLCIGMVKEHVHGGQWLDIGCSFGWFLDRIRAGGYESFGIEPSPTAFDFASKSSPGRVLNGEFPDTLATAQGFPPQFSVLSAMDVLEHIPDPSAFLGAAREMLTPGGALLLKVPSNDGILFRLTSKLSSPKRHATLGRLWQVDFNYPHWHYYCQESIRRMVEQHGFRIVAQRSIPFSFLSTAHDRVRNYDGKHEPLLGRAAKTIAAYLLISLSYLVRRFDNVIVVATPHTTAPATAASFNKNRQSE